MARIHEDCVGWLHVPVEETDRIVKIFQRRAHVVRECDRQDRANRSASSRMQQLRQAAVGGEGEEEAVLRRHL
eukprot:761112-Hanusia_phi.AAC.2